MLYTFTAVILFGLATSAGAEPKQGSGGGKCTCMCYAPTGVNGGAFVGNVSYDSKGYACNAFEGKTCNVNNPYTGGVSTGSLIGCENSTTSNAARGITVLPPGSVSVAPPTGNPAPKPTVPKAVTGGAGRQ